MPFMYHRCSFLSLFCFIAKLSGAVSMKPQDILNQIGQLNREIQARQDQARSLQTEFNALKQADFERIKKSVTYKVTAVEPATREKMKAFGAVVLVLQTDNTTMDADLREHVESFGPLKDGAELPKREIRSLAYFYAGGRIWHDGGGHHIIAKAHGDTWGDNGTPATQEQWEMVKAGKIPAELVGEYFTVNNG